MDWELVGLDREAGSGEVETASEDLDPWAEGVRVPGGAFWVPAGS